MYTKGFPVINFRQGKVHGSRNMTLQIFYSWSRIDYSGLGIFYMLCQPRIVYEVNHQDSSESLEGVLGREIIYSASKDGVTLTSRATVWVTTDLFQASFQIFSRVSGVASAFTYIFAF